MAEKMQPKIPLPASLVRARPAKQAKKRKKEAEKAATRKTLDKARGQTRLTSVDTTEDLKGLKGSALCQRNLPPSTGATTGLLWPGMVDEFEKKMNKFKNMIPFDQMTIEDLNDTFPETKLDKEKHPYWPHKPIAAL